MKNKRLSFNQKITINLFNNLLDIIFPENNSNNDNDNKNDNGNDNDNKNDNENNNENENDNNNENDNDNVNVNDNYNNNENENENDNENEYENYDDYKIKKINDYFKMIDESVSFQEQINLLKIMDDINWYWHVSYYDNDKDLNLKIFKIKCAFLSNDLD